MHYYSFNIGDYVKDTTHLSELEDLAYRRMLDLYYSREQPLPKDHEEIARLIRMRTHCERIATVLKDFFSLEDDGYHQLRIDAEISAYKEKSDKARLSASARWKKEKKKQKVTAECERNANAMRTQCEGNAKQETINNKQETRNKPSCAKFSTKHMETAKWMFGLILNVASKTKEPDFEKWANEIRLMESVDKIEISEICNVFSWANSDEFWKVNILSPEKLRKQYATLHAKMNATKKTASIFDLSGKNYVSGDL